MPPLKTGVARPTHINTPGTLPQVEGGTADHTPGDGYAAVMGGVSSNKGRMRGLYDDNSDFDRIKMKAESMYLAGDYEGCARYETRACTHTSTSTNFDAKRWTDGD